MSRSVGRGDVGTSLEHNRADCGRTVALVWAGMVLGVSFLTTRAKFLAHSLPRPVALDVGRPTFRTFGWIEVALAAVLGLSAAAPARRGRPRQGIVQAAIFDLRGKRAERRSGGCHSNGRN